jgi:hypothetical protein
MGDSFSSVIAAFDRIARANGVSTASWFQKSTNWGKIKVSSVDI